MLGNISKTTISAHTHIFQPEISIENTNLRYFKIIHLEKCMKNKKYFSLAPYNYSNKYESVIVHLEYDEYAKEGRIGYLIKMQEVKIINTKNNALQ